MKKILMVVDYQNDFVVGSLGFPKAVELDKPISERIMRAMKDQERIIYTLDTHYEDYLETQEGKKLPIKHCVKGTNGWGLYGESGKLLKDALAVEKCTFGAISLDKVLEDLKSEEDIEIEICGVVTNMCVISNAIICKSIFPEANIVVNAGLCASFDDELHEKALDLMEAMQITILGRD